MCEKYTHTHTRTQDSKPVSLLQKNNKSTHYSHQISCFFSYRFQDKLIPNPAWKDYSANTNYAFDTTDATVDDKQKRGTSRSSQQTLPLAHVPLKSQYYESSRHHAAAAPAPQYDVGHSNGNRYANGNGNDYYQSREPMARSTYAERTYSLPRQAPQQQHQRQSQPAYSDAYYTQDRRNRTGRSGHNSSNSHHYDDAGVAQANFDKPDFYFMPSQRKYSGEVVRVYVDYNKDAKK